MKTVAYSHTVIDNWLATNTGSLGFASLSVGIKPQDHVFSLKVVALGTDTGESLAVAASDRMLVKHMLRAMLANGRRVYAHQARDISWGLAKDTGDRVTPLLCTMTAAQTALPGRAEGYSLASLRPNAQAAFEALRTARRARPGTPLKSWLPAAMTVLDPLSDPVTDLVSTLAVETACLAKEILTGEHSEAAWTRMDVEQVWRWQGYDGIKLDKRATQAAAGRLRVQASQAARQLGFDATNPTAAKQWAERHGIQLPVSPAGQVTLSRQKISEAVVPAGLEDQWALFLKARSLGSFTGKLTELLAAADSDSLVHPEVRIFTDNAATGRMSVSKPALQNLANAELEGTGLSTLRNCLTAMPGKVLVSCDLAHVEPSVLAAITQDPALMKAVAKESDVYVETAVKLWGEESRSSKDARSRAKTLLLALLYGKGDESLAADLGCTVAKAREAKERLLGSYPVMGAWVQEIRAKAKEGEQLMTAYRRPVASLTPAEAYKAINYLIQGTAADLLVEMTLDIADALDEHFPTARLWLPVHDELVIECDEADAERVRGMLEALMTTELDGVPIWGEAEVLGAVWTK